MARGLTVGAITQRDRRLFQFLFESKAITLRQMCQIFFVGVSKQAACKRLSQLVKSGLLERSSHEIDGRFQIVFSLSDKAYREYVRIEGVNDRRAQLASDKVRHDVVLVDIRRRLEQRSTVKQIYPENVILSRQDLAEMREFKHSAALRSDAVVAITNEGQSTFYIPLEYEASQKTKDRWEEKLLDYYLKHDTEVVLWVCKEDSTIRQMSAVDLSLRTGYASKMYFASLENVLKTPGEVTFVSSMKDKRVTI